MWILTFIQVTFCMAWQSGEHWGMIGVCINTPFYAFSVYGALKYSHLT